MRVSSGGAAHTAVDEMGRGDRALGVEIGDWCRSAGAELGISKSVRCERTGKKTLRKRLGGGLIILLFKTPIGGTMLSCIYLFDIINMNC